MLLLQIEEKNKHKQLIVCLIFLGKILQIVIDNNYCIKMWQLWDFRPTSFKFCIDIELLIFEFFRKRVTKLSEKIIIWKENEPQGGGNKGGTINGNGDVFIVKEMKERDNNGMKTFAMAEMDECECWLPKWWITASGS